MAQSKSNSKVQRDIEKDMLACLHRQHADWHEVDWLNLSVGREFAVKVKPDGVWCDPEGVIIIAESYARIGKLKPGHRRKIAADILKLISLKDEFGEDSSPCLLLVVPEDLGSQLEGSDWLSIVIRKTIRLIKVPLTDEQRHNLSDAVKLQAEGQAHSPKSDDDPDSLENPSMSLDKDFHHAMIGVADFANRHQFGIRFRQMIDEFGAVETAKRLLASPEVQTGLMKLWELRSLDKSMEALVVQSRFHSLFCNEQIEEARRRLDELGYVVK
jgi:hypothetical protein